MFCLTDEVRCDNMRIGSFIRNHCNFSGPGKHVNADSSIKDTFRFSNKSVAGTDQNIRRMPRKQAKCHRSNTLHAAEGEDGRGFR